ncbi:hypothetical protein JJB09_25590 [Rhizobium sp. KVB221]|uniref:Uncharacterized protein n=1 Tax=Rhizobium setariae TaxID=2801340 RepID=A0A936YRA5_9HYPH|nr:hypothetical protein [Rhizobium setariae]MBL0375389.1 hypothetical protein [Rhizobium setariae]
MESLLSTNAILAARVSLSNVRKTYEFEQACVCFDLLIDGKSVGSSLEWLADNGELVRQDCHLDINPDIFDAAEQAIGDDEIDALDISLAVQALLEEALANDVPAGDLFDFDNDKA